MGTLDEIQRLSDGNSTCLVTTCCEGTIPDTGDFVDRGLKWGHFRGLRGGQWELPSEAERAL